MRSDIFIKLKKYMDKKKTTILSLLLLMVVFLFSGCSIRKVKEEKEKLPETKKRSEITNIDSDNDGLLDKKEKEIGTDPNNPDTDGDGLNDYDETKKWKTNPNNPDTDGDGYSDKQEIENGYNPNGQG